MRFLTHLFAVVMVVSLFTIGEADAAKRSKKKPKGLARSSIVLTFDQVARLSHARRTQYVKLMREAARDVEKHQKVFDKRKASAALSDDSFEKYALLDYVAEWLLGPLADAEEEERMECIFAGHVSGYPSSGRVPFQCKEVLCEYSGTGRLDGVSCDWQSTGLVNQTDIGCLSAANKHEASLNCYGRKKQLSELNRTREVTDPATNTKIRVPGGPIQDVLSKTNEYFGFTPPDSSVIGDFNYEEGFDSDTAKNLISDLIRMSYDDEVKAQLIKVVYFYKTSGHCVPEDLPVFRTDNLDSTERAKVNRTRREVETVIGKIVPGPCGIDRAIERDFNKLNQAVENIYRRHIDNCYSELPPNVVKDIVTGANIRSPSNPTGAAQGTGAWYLEKERQELLQKECPFLGNNPSDADVARCKVTHISVLEKDECELVINNYRGVLAEVERIKGSMPNPRTNPPPNIPTDPAGPDDRYTKVEATGCNTEVIPSEEGLPARWLLTENVTKEESLLSQPASRCMSCLIQKHEERKNSGNPNASPYTNSKKYESLVSTMALACGDGRIYNSTLLPEARLHYWHAFGHCANENYQWTPEDRVYADKILEWNKQNDFLRSITGSPRSNSNARRNADHPDHGGTFKKIYGISFVTATKLFCPEDRVKYSIFKKRARGYVLPDDNERRTWENDTRNVLISQRRNFGEQKRKLKRKVGRQDDYDETVEEHLLECLNEAEQKIAELNNTTNMCMGTAPLTPQFNTAAENAFKQNFMTDPPLIFSGASCYIPKARETMKTTADGKPCLDKDRDNKDDRNGAECSGVPKVGYVYVNPSEYKVLDQNSPDGYRRYSMALGSGDTLPHITLLSNSTPVDVIGKSSFTVRSNNACPITPAESRNAVGGRRSDR